MASSSVDERAQLIHDNQLLRDRLQTMDDKCSRLADANRALQTELEQVAIKERQPYFGLGMKHVSLFLLVAQNTALVFTTRASRRTDGPIYVAATAVLIGEIIKFLTCCVILWYDELNKLVLMRTSAQLVSIGMRQTAWQIFMVVPHSLYSTECIKMAVPSLLYVAQNNLLYMALSNLDAAIFQVTCQLKILTTAACSISMLQRKLSHMQIGALFLLMGGVALVQLDEQGAKHTVATSDSGLKQSSVVGFASVLAAMCTSGFAGVYFEKVLKSGSLSLWTRNVQLSAFGVVLAAASVCASSEDLDTVSEHGLLYGYTPLVWTVVMLNAFGGLCVAVVVKYASSVAKSFATSVSVVLSCAISIYVLHTFTPTAQFYFGTALVLVATKLYTDYPWVTDGRGSSQELSAIVTTDPVSPRKSGPGPDPSRP